MVCGDAPLLCDECSPVNIENVPSGEPPACTWTWTTVDAAEAEDAGFPVNDYLSGVEGTFDAPVRFEHAAIEDIWTVGVRQTGNYALVEGEGEEFADPNGCPSRLEVELVLDLTSPDCTIVGTLQGWAALPMAPDPAFSSVKLTGSAHELHGHVIVKPPALAMPQGLIATFHLIRFKDDSDGVRVGLDVDGFYTGVEDTGDTWTEIFESVTPVDGCPAWTTPTGDDCTAL